MNTYCGDCDVEFNYYDYEIIDEDVGMIITFI